MDNEPDDAKAKDGEGKGGKEKPKKGKPADQEGDIFPDDNFPTNDIGSYLVGSEARDLARLFDGLQHYADRDITQLEYINWVKFHFMNKEYQSARNALDKIRQSAFSREHLIIISKLYETIYNKIYKIDESLEIDTNDKGYESDS